MVELYGGAPYSGIAPSARTPDVLVYIDPAEGRKHGYIFDGPSDDGTAFYYTGHAPTGDQELKDGNRAIYEHAQTGRSLRLFTAVGFVEGTKTKKQQYVGDFHLDPDAPMRREPHVDANNTTCTVIVFRLLPGAGAVLTTPEGDHQRPPTPTAGRQPPSSPAKSSPHTSTRPPAAHPEPPDATKAPSSAPSKPPGKDQRSSDGRSPSPGNELLCSRTCTTPKPGSSTRRKPPAHVAVSAWRSDSSPTTAATSPSPTCDAHSYSPSAPPQTSATSSPATTSP